jgi:hypothetical protein
VDGSNDTQSSAMSSAFRAPSLRTAGVRAVQLFTDWVTPAGRRIKKIRVSMGRSVRRRFVAVGHIANDTAPHDYLGGGVAYSAVAARRKDL